MTIFTARDEVREAQDALVKARKNWNTALDEFVKKEFPEPIILKRKGKEYAGLLTTVIWCDFAEIRFLPFKRDGSLSKATWTNPYVSRFELRRVSTEEELKKKIEEEMGLRVKDTEIETE